MARSWISKLPTVTGATSASCAMRITGSSSVRPQPPPVCSADWVTRYTACVAKSFALDTLRMISFTGRPLSQSRAASYVSCRVASMSTKDWAMGKAMAWLDPMGRPNCWRTLA